MVYNPTINGGENNYTTYEYCPTLYEKFVSNKLYSNDQNVP